MASKVLTVVFDTNIFVQYFLSPKGVAGRCLEAVETRQVSLVVSADLLREVRDVLVRPAMLARIENATAEQIEAYLDYISDRSTLIDRVPRRFQLPRDPKDEMIVDLAIVAEAEYLVTYDRDLLDLMTGYEDECKAFRQRFRQIRIIDPNDFISKGFGVE